ncbi:uncharacterized protein LOC136071744 [Hydra vulgaris]|uniref:uncharacterized protein LOC136071744 n=1 Tax=Hydra vulgaris TaxID=6087 RepID=UPI0032EA358B
MTALLEGSLRPSRLDTLPNSPSATKLFKHWLRTFKYYLDELPQELNKLKILTNFVVPGVYEIINECPNYEAAIQALQSVYIKPSNKVYARHLLATRKQQPGESFDEYLHALKVLAKKCNFKQVSAIEYHDEYIRDALITGINSQVVRQRLLENSTISLDEIFSKARTLKSAQKNAENYLQHNTLNTTVAAITKKPKQFNSNSVSNCWNCGNQRYAKAVCPAGESICFKCEKVGHFAKLCKSSKVTRTGMNLVDQRLNSYNHLLD